jgi:ABC-type Fe3+/spermidine/putrescine transport system ATPase subunit
MAVPQDHVMSSRPALACRKVTIAYGAISVLDDVSLEVAQGETVALLGPSGSGKTSLLYAVAGLLSPSAGEIEIAGDIVTSDGISAAPEDRSIGMVFQNYALWPHLSAVQTVAYPLERRGLDRAEAQQQAMSLLGRVGISDLADRLPDQMSGGQQQRVGLARALAVQPAVYLFDEPTAHLDPGLRDDLQQELVAQSDAAAVYTTHDATEALAVADRVAVLADGRIAQVGSPEEIYCTPLNRGVASLTGAVSTVSATVIAAVGDGYDIECGGTTIRVRGHGRAIGEVVRVMVRPDWVICDGTIAGVITAARYEGPHTDYRIETSVGTVQVREVGVQRRQVGAATGIAIGDGWILPS